MFDVAPKQIEKNKRYFQGRIWVDDRDFQIVKTYGKNVPDLGVKKRGQENLFPNFTTWRDRVDGKYWFPVYTKVDDVLHFSSGDIHIKQIVKYTDYKRFGAKVKITYEGQDIGTDGDTTKQQPATQTPPPSTPPPNASSSCYSCSSLKSQPLWINDQWNRTPRAFFGNSCEYRLPWRLSEKQIANGFQ